MSLKHRGEDLKEVLAAVDSATVIAIGDLLYLDTDDVKPAGDAADTATEAGNQEAFHDIFLGVAMQASAVGETKAIRVATAGVFEYTTPSGTFEVGDLVGVDEAASGTALENQVVDNVATANLAIGRCVKREAVAVTSVLVRIESTVMSGGPQAAA